MHEILFFSRKPENILGFTSKFRLGWVTLNTGPYKYSNEGQYSLLSVWAINVLYIFDCVQHKFFIIIM